jgi:hypothetical protein
MANWHDVKYAATQASLLVGLVGAAAFVFFGWRVIFAMHPGDLSKFLFQRRSLLSATGARHLQIALVGLVVAAVAGFGAPLLIDRLP